MNIELKPIAESKVRQLGGDVCGVLVRKDGRLAAVDEHGRVTWLPDGTDYAAISSRAIGDIAKVTELLGVPEEEAGRPIVELVKEYLAAQSCNSAPSEQGKNRYGLDMAYFRELFNRELNRPLVDFRPDELARVLARAARTADAAVLQEPEFQAARAQSRQGAEAVAWCHEKVFAENIGRGHRFEGTTRKPEGVHAVGMVPLYTQPQPAQEDPDLQLIRERDYWEGKATELAEDVGKLLGVEVGEHSSANCPVQNAIDAVFRAAECPAQQGGVPDGWRECLQEMVQAMHDYEMSVDEDAPYKRRSMMDRAHALLSTPATPQADGWVRCDDRLPDFVGHYDAYSPTDGGRYPDAYWDGERWENEMDGFPIRGVTHYCEPSLPQPPKQEGEL